MPKSVGAEEALRLMEKGFMCQYADKVY
jgi:hypothetical protein